MEPKLPRSVKFKRLLPHLEWVRQQVGACVLRREIAASLGISVARLSDFMAHHNIAYDRGKLTRRRAARLAELRRNPDFEAHRRARHAEFTWTPAMRAAQSAITKARWRDPVRRQRMVDAVRAALQIRDIRLEQQKRCAEARAALARKLAEKRAEAELQERLAKLPPFERKLELIRLGRIKIVERQPVRVGLGGIPLYR
jgi:hypothetical protein